MSTLPQPSVETTPPAATLDWVALLARGGLALALGVTITFSPDHSARFGLLVFGVFAVVTGAVQLAAALAARRAARPVGLELLQAVVALVAGVAALAVPLAEESLFVGLVSAWAVLTGGSELVAGLRSRRRGEPARDSFTLGALALLLALVLLVVPPDYVQPWQVTDRDGAVEASGAVTASIMVVGILGAWAVIHGLLLVIAGVSARRPAGDDGGSR